MSAIDPLDAIVDFDPGYINDGSLGAAWKIPGVMTHHDGERASSWIR